MSVRRFHETPIFVSENGLSFTPLSVPARFPTKLWPTVAVQRLGNNPDPVCTEGTVRSYGSYQLLLRNATTAEANG